MRASGAAKITPGKELADIVKYLTFLVIGILFFIAVVLAIFYRDQGFTISIPLPTGGTIEAKFEGNSANIIDVLECLLGERGEKNSKCKTTSGSDPQIAKRVLADYGYYRLPSREAGDAIRGMREIDDTNEFAQTIRSTLYDLQGPFAIPWTFRGADDRLLDALKDLYTKDPSHRLIATLWTWSLDGEEIFLTPRIKISLEVDDSMPKGHGAACESILLGRDSLITMETSNDSSVVPIYFDHPRQAGCRNLSTKDLLSGRQTRVWISQNDYDELLKNKLTERAGEAPTVELIPLSKKLRYYVPRGEKRSS